MNFSQEKIILEDCQKNKIPEIIELMNALEILYTKGTSRSLRSKIREIKQILQTIQKDCLEQDKVYINSLPQSEQKKRGRKPGQKNGYSNPK